MKHDRARQRSADDGRERRWFPSQIPGWVAPSVSVAIALYVGVASFPGLSRAFGPGVDASWAYAINVLPHTDLLFGRDVLFTYGPLGYLAVPSAVGSNLVHGAIVRLVAQLGLVALLVRSFRRTGSVAPVITFALLFLLALTSPVSFDYRLLLLLGITLGVAPRTGPWWSVASVAVSVVAAVLLFVKFSAGVTALAMLTVWSGAVVATGRTRLRRILAWVAVPYALGVGVLAALYLRTPATFGQWLTGSVEIVRGYPSAMPVPIPAVLLWLGFLSLAVFVGGAVMLAWKDRSSGAAGAALIVLVLIAFRHSFTRSGHDYFSILMASSAALVLLARGGRALRRAMVTAIALVPIFLLGSSASPVFPVPSFLDPMDGWRSVQAVLTPSQLRREVLVTSRKALAVDRLPPEWVPDMRASDGVDTIPAEIAFVPANDLKWIPNPLLQTYQAYTPALDARVAEHFRSSKAPPFLLAQFVNIDRRHPMLDVPATWRSIIGSYEMDRYENVALLRRRETPLRMNLRVAAQGRAELGTWIDVPSTRGFLFLSARFHQNILGQLADAFWRLDRLFLDLRYADGRLVTWQILPATAENGLLMAPLPSCYAELVALMENRAVSPVRQIRFHGAGTTFYEQHADLVWLEAPGAVQPQGPSGGVC